LSQHLVFGLGREDFKTLHQGQTCIDHRTELSCKYDEVLVGETRTEIYLESASATLFLFKARDDYALLTALIHLLLAGFCAQLTFLDGTRSGSSHICTGSHAQLSPFDMAIALAGCRPSEIYTWRVYWPPPNLSNKCTISAQSARHTGPDNSTL